MSGPFVLVADDDADIRELVALTLQRRGYAVVVAADGAEAVERARERRPDLAILDVRMPKLDGYGVLSALRADTEASYVPVVVLTASVQEGERARARAIGAEVFLQKPFDRNELLAHVERLLAASRGTVQRERR